MTDVSSEQPSKKDRVRAYWSLLSPKKRFWIIFSAAALALIAVGLIIWSIVLLSQTGSNNSTGTTNTQQSANSLQKKVCSKEQITQAAALIASKDTLALYPMTNDIRAKKDYDYDQNCLYILLQYNFLNNVSNGNDKLLASYEKVHTSLDSGFGPYVMDLVAIRARVESLEAHQAQTDKNSEVYQKYNDLESVNAPTE
jgi:hypothetical protein